MFPARQTDAPAEPDLRLSQAKGYAAAHLVRGVVDAKQALKELRTELAVNERIATLLQQVAKDTADADLRRTYTQLDHAAMLRLTGAAAGVEDFISQIMGKPT